MLERGEEGEGKARVTLLLVRCALSLFDDHLEIPLHCASLLCMKTLGPIALDGGSDRGKCKKN